MVQAGREVRSQTDYILGTDFCLFRNVTVRDPWRNSDHYLVLGCLHSPPLMGILRVLGRSKQLPLRPPTTQTREDGFFADLHRTVLNPKTREARKKVWISEATWRIVDKRVSARQDLARGQSLIQRLVCAINARLEGGRRRRMEEAGEEVERLLVTPPPPPGILAPDEDVVLVCGRPHAAICLGYP